MNTKSFKIGKLYRKSRSRPEDSLPGCLQSVSKVDGVWRGSTGKGVRWYDQPILLIDIQLALAPGLGFAVGLMDEQFVALFRAEVEELT